MLIEIRRKVHDTLDVIEHSAMAEMADRTSSAWFVKGERYCAEEEGYGSVVRCCFGKTQLNLQRPHL